MQTMYVGTLEARERLEKTERKKYAAIFGAVAFVVALLSYLAALITR